MIIKNPEACQRTLAFARKKHVGQQRRTLDPFEMEPLDYVESHVVGVANLAVNLLPVEIIPVEYQELLDNYGLDFIHHVAYLHDVLEDTTAEGFPDETGRGNLDERGHCLNLRFEMRSALAEGGLDQTGCNQVINAVRALSHWPRRERGDYKKEMDILRQSSFIVRWVKLMDNFYNLKNVLGFSSLAALRSYIHYREGWNQIFSETELTSLRRVGLMESPQALTEITFLMRGLQKQITGEIYGTEASLPKSFDHLYNQVVGPHTRNQGLGLWINPETNHRSAKDKLTNLILALGESRGRLIPRSAEEEILSCMTVEEPSEQQTTLTLAEANGLEMMKQLVMDACEQNSQLNRGIVIGTDPVYRGRIYSFLTLIGMTGRDFIEKVQTDEHFSDLLEQAYRVVRSNYEQEEKQRT